METTHSTATASPVMAQPAAPAPPVEAGPGGLLEFLNPEAIPYLLILLVLTVLFVRLINHGGNRLAERVAARRLLIKNVVTILGFTTYTAYVFVAVSSLFRLSSQALFALSGTAAVAIGFSLKDLAASLMAGISILVTKPFQVGDRISFGGYYGEVKEIGLRNVQLVTLDDNLVTIPTNKFLTDAVASANAGALDCMVVISFPIDARADHRRARQIVQDGLFASKYLYLGKPTSVLVSTEVSTTGTAYVVLTAKAYVYDTRHEKPFASDVTDRVLAAFKLEGIALARSGGGAAMVEVA